MLNKLRLLTPGPTLLPERVRFAMAKDMIHHRKPEFKAIMQEVQKGLQKLFATKQIVLPLSCSGTGAMTAAVEGLFQKGEKVLIANAGKFAERWIKIAENCELEIICIDKPWGEAITLEDIKLSLADNPSISGLLIQQSETSTTVMHPIQEIASFMAGTDILLVVDGISGVGVSACPMDSWGIDCLITGSQKGLMLPPGLALLALSARAWDKATKIKPRSFYFNLLKEKAKVEVGETLFTSPISLIVGLNESLKMFEEVGFENIYNKSLSLALMVRKAAELLNLELLAKEHYAHGVTGILMPSGISASKVLAIIAKEYGIIMAGGQDQLKGRLIRIGHMGFVDFADIAAGLYALFESIKQEFFTLKENKELSAVELAWFENWLETYPKDWLTQTIDTYFLTFNALTFNRG